MIRTYATFGIILCMLLSMVPPSGLHVGSSSILQKTPTSMIQNSENSPPTTPRQPNGPTNCIIGFSYTFQTNATDPQDQSIQYGWDWDDGSDIEWTEWYASGATNNQSHIYYSTGLYMIRVKARDNHSAESNWSESLSITVSNTKPNTPSRPYERKGLTTGIVGKYYVFKTNISDPDEHRVRAGWDFDDGSPLEWTRYYPSNSTALESHKWTKEGIFSIRVLAEDQYGAERSNWSEIRNFTIINTPPAPPQQPQGPSTGKLGTYYTFSTTSTDDDDHLLRYGWDWNEDHLVDEWSDHYYSSDSTCSMTHKWTSWEDATNLSIFVLAQDYYGKNSTWSKPHNITLTNGLYPPSPLTGPLTVTAGDINTYQTAAHDPDGNLIQYHYDWGDYTQEWLPLGLPNVTTSREHLWTTQGTYDIRVRAKDQFGLITNWSDTVTVTVSEPPFWQWWPMAHHDAIQSGRCPSEGPTNNSINWTTPLSGSLQSTTPIIYKDKVYISTSLPSRLCCYDVKTGEALWSHALQNTVRSPVVLSDRVVLGDGNSLYCWDAESGTQLWNSTVTGEILVSPVIYDTSIYLATWYGIIYCIGLEEGTILWETSLGYDVHFTVSSPAVTNNRLYIGSSEDEDGKLYGLDPCTGKLLWFFAPGADIKSTPATAYGHVYVGADNGRIYCVDAATGEPCWTFTAGGDGFFIRSSPSIYNGTVIVGSADQTLYCLDAMKGTLRWSYDTGVFVYSSPVVTSNRVYLGHLSGGSDNVRCLSADTGEELWTYTTGSTSWSSASLAHEKLFVGGDNELLCFGPPKAPEPDPPILEITELLGGKGIKAKVRNTGETDALEISWKIHIENGIIMIPRQDQGTTSRLAVDGSYDFSMMVTGFGLGILTEPPKITVTVSATNAEPVTLTKQALIIGFLVLLY